MSKKRLVNIGTILLLISIITILFLYLKDARVQQYMLNNNKFDLINVDNYEVFLTGETHTMAKSDEFKKTFFSYLNKNAGVKNIIEEVGFCSGLLLNRYLQTGNEKDLEFYMKQLKGTMAYNKEKYEFYKWLYKYNMQLAEEDKITIYGIDIEHQPLTAIMGISTLIDTNKEVPHSLEKAIRYVKEINPDASLYLKLAYDNNKKDCEEYFGKNFIIFENCIKNLYQKETENDTRDKVMMDNFSFIYSLNKDEKFFGQLGSEHIYQDYLDSDYTSREEVRLGILLNNNNSPVKDKVYSLLCVYKSIDSTNPSKQVFDYSLIKNYKQDMFVDLSQENSPFYKKNYFFKDKKNSGSTCDYIQGLMILINSNETTPLYNKSATSFLTMFIPPLIIGKV